MKNPGCPLEAEPPADCTYVSVLHGADVGPEAAVSGGENSFHALLKLVQMHGECGERVELPERESDRCIAAANRPETNQQTARPHTPDL